MVRRITTILFFVCTSLLLVSTCSLPLDPAKNPENATVSLFLPDRNNAVHQGTHKQIGMRVTYPQHIDFYRVTSTCGGFDTTIKPALLEDDDTVYFSPLFQNAGTCTLHVAAEYIDTHYKGITDTLIMVVLPGEPSLNFSVIPVAFTMHTGATDTVRFVVDAWQVNNISYTVTCNPDVDSTDLHLIIPIVGDTVLIHFDPASADTYTVLLSATAGGLSTSASVTITVLDTLPPIPVENHLTLFIGIPDTLIFALTPEQVVNGVTMELLDAQNLPVDIATVIPSSADSLIIAVNSAKDGAYSFSIATHNGTLTDTATYTFSFVDQSNAFWKTASATANAVEGQQCSFDLTPYLFEGVLVGTIAPTASVGSFNDSGAWYYTPPWGSEATVTVTITGKRGEKSQDFILALNVAPGDKSAPEITLLSPATESKAVSSSQVMVSVMVKDSGAGVGKVTFATAAAGTLIGTAENDSTYTAVITGLPEGVATDVIITASDKSMNKNHSTTTITLTYDSTVEDGDAPVILPIEGPQSGSRVTSATGTITYSVCDDSGVDSVWWTRNDTFVAAVSASTDNKYTISYELANFGENTLTLYAKDSSSGANEGSKTITLNYNTAVSDITPSGPLNKATDVSLTPSFTWTGGTDADGDSVYYRVSYGTTENSLTTKSAETKEHSFSVLAANKLAESTSYYWQVTAYTKKPYTDTVESETASFTTAGSGPSITTNLPVTAKVIEGGVLTLKIIAAGTPLPTFKWYKDDILQTGQTDAEFSKNITTAADSGTYYVVVNNGIGIGVTSTKTVVTVRLKAIITQEPVGTTVNEGGDGSFTVKAAGEVPLSYQWLKDGSPLIGDTSATYVFKGAKTVDDGKKFSCFVSNSLGKDTSVAALLTVTSKPIYTVIFNAGVGVAGPDEQQVAEGGKAAQPSSPTRTGYDFVGWYKETGTTTAWNFTTDVVTSSITLYAKWSTSTYTVTFDAKSGSAVAPITTVVHGDKIDKPSPNPTRTGYDFVGWYKETGTTTAWNFTTDVVTSSITLYAKWTAVCTVTFDGQGATTAPNPTSKSITANTSIGSLPTNPGKTGYVFDGWYMGTNGTGIKVTTSLTFSNSTTVYANWVIKDFDGNEYHEVTIGTQVWMVENLKTTHYSNGTSIPLLADQGSWTSDSYGAYCWYDNLVSNKDTYGALYNWHAVNSLSKLAPNGWHVPTEDEWAMLTQSLGGDALAGRALKEIGTTHWTAYPDCSDCEGTNTSGFTALPGGFRFRDGMFMSSINNSGYWWSATDAGSTTAWYNFMAYTSAGVTRSSNQGNYLMGCSVRCVKDE